MVSCVRPQPNCFSDPAQLCDTSPAQRTPAGGTLSIVELALDNGPSCFDQRFGVLLKQSDSPFLCRLHSDMQNCDICRDSKRAPPYLQSASIEVGRCWYGRD
jgi:hypothetical protein